MRQATQTVRALQELAIFRNLDADEVRRIVDAGRIAEVYAGDVVVTEGELGGECYVILRGRASVIRDGRRVAELGPGGYFGELSMLYGAARSATVRMSADGELLVLSRSDMRAILNDCSHIALRLLEDFARRLYEVERPRAAVGYAVS
jgi:CRP-like cAMP-binding protein